MSAWERGNNIMDNEYDRFRIDQSELISNPSTRLPVCVCVDASASMLVQSRLKKLNQGIRRFIQEMRQDLYAVDSIELCIITFGGKEAKIQHPFSGINKFEFIDIKAEGETPLGKAAELAIEVIDERLSDYEIVGIQYYKPWLIIISDGEANDSYLSAARKICQKESDGTLKVLPIALDGMRTCLEKFTNSEKVSQLHELKVNEFFAWLSKSMSAQSKSSAYYDENIARDSWDAQLI